jgi:hypothetical protein
MTNPSSTKSSSRHVANTLFAIATLAPVSIIGAGFAPPWVAAAIGGAALFGGLVAMWREGGGLRGIFIVALVGAVAASGIAGWLMSRPT